MGRPLVQRIVSSTDSFWACLAYRAYESDSVERIKLIRTKVLLHFVALLFSASFDTLEDFFASRDLEVTTNNPRTYRHPAIQVWIQRLHKQKKLSTSDIRSVTSTGTLRELATQFVRQNQTRCTCRFTLCYLFGSIFSYDVYLHDLVKKRTDILAVYHPNQLQDVDITFLTVEGARNTNAQGKEEYFIYMVYTGSEFQLWLPLRNTRTIMNESTKHVTKKTALYQLVRCTTGEVFPMGYFDTLGKLHYCCIEDGIAGIYRVLPSDHREFSVTTPLFIYVTCNAGCKLAGYIDQDGGPAAFFLDPTINKTVIVMRHEDQSIVEQTIQEETKLKVLI